jgi:hypothetical protein
LGKFTLVKKLGPGAVSARTVAAAALLASLAGCAAGASTGTTAAAARPAAGQPSAAAAVTPTAAAVATLPQAARSSAPPTPTAPSALPVAPASEATLPQTTAYPKTASAAFTAEVHDIWLAVTTGDPDYAKPAFFPEKAYEQVKAIADPQSDWTDRLWLDFTLDVAAAHKLLKPGATLVKVEVPAQYAQWIPVGACYNAAGYWHVPGARVVYRRGGTTSSFGIMSFISWRGEWYVIHLGALSRSAAYGIVDAPSSGPGIPGPPGGC